MISKVTKNKAWHSSDSMFFEMYLVLKRGYFSNESSTQVFVELAIFQSI